MALFERSLIWLPVCSLLLASFAAPALVEGEDSPTSKNTGAIPEKSDAGPFEVPEGTPEELFRFINQVKRLRPAERSQEAIIAHVKKQITAVIIATDRVLAQESSDTDAVRAFEEKFAGLSVMARFDQEAQQQLLALAKSLQKDPRAAVVQLADFQMLQQGIMQILQGGGKPGEIVGLVFGFIEKHGLDKGVVDLTSQIGQILSGNNAEVTKILLSRMVTLMEESDDPEILARLPTIAATARRLSLPGNFMELSGVTADGHEFDWESYRGNFVLIDFWASWCGPCREEIPNVMKNLEKYSETGFQVVGINIDQDRSAFDTYMQEAQLPWQNIMPDENGNSEMATYYAVSGIPTVILVDREGKVVSLNARGAELGRLLETHLANDKDTGDVQ